MELADRMKNYEDKYRTYIPVEDSVIIRIDGSNFSNLTRNLKKPYDDNFINLMNDTARYIISEVSGFRFATVQSDEINICLQLYNVKQEPYYGNNVNKINSLLSAYASSYFSVHSSKAFGDTKVIQFDARCFGLPKEEVVNYFIYRQQDTIRNSIQMAARTHFSHKQVNCKNSNEMKEMLKNSGNDFDNLPNYFRMGRSIYKIQVEKISDYDGKLVN